MLGLFARTFHAGVDHLAFQLVAPLGLQPATAVIGKTYGAAHVVAALTLAIMFGWPVLAAGAWRAGVLPGWRALALASMAGLMLGVLKGSSWTSVMRPGMRSCLPARFGIQKLWITSVDFSVTCTGVSTGK